MVPRTVHYAAILSMSLWFRLLPYAAMLLMSLMTTENHEEPVPRAAEALHG